MSTRVKWQADSINFRFQSFGPQPGVTVTPLSEIHGRDIISDAVNNMRLGRSAIVERHVSLAHILGFSTEHEFSFEAHDSGILTSNLCVAPQGTVTLVAFDDFLGQIPGTAAFQLYAKLLTVVSRIGQGDVVSTVSPWFATHLFQKINDSEILGIDIAPFDFVIHHNTRLQVQRGDLINLVGSYYVASQASRGAIVEVDFHTEQDTVNPPGDGLNFPFASVTIL